MTLVDHRQSASARRSGFVRAGLARGLLTLLITGLTFTADPRRSVGQNQESRGPARATTGGRKQSYAGNLRRAPVPWDDQTYRPTVMVRRGTSQGSGTIIASVDGETLILTAAHVVKANGPIVVELHRYNLGMERQPRVPGVWPQVVDCSLAATDEAADLAIVRIRKMAALPYVARLAHDEEELLPDAIVVSIGIDQGRKLTRWNSRLLETVRFKLNDNDKSRPFLITEKIPEHGRSGGGLFLASGELVGVCVGHSELVKGKRSGVFAARESIRRLLEDGDLTDIIVRSEHRLTRLKRERFPTASSPRPRSGSDVTPTRSDVDRTGAPSSL
jgi:S1-C subfamily serine protease